MSSAFLARILIACLIAIPAAAQPPAAGPENDLQALRSEIQELRKLVRRLELTTAAGLKRLELVRTADQTTRFASEKYDLEQSLESIREERTTADPESMARLNQQESHLMTDLAQMSVRLEQSTRAAMELQNHISQIEHELSVPHAALGAKPEVANQKP